MFHISLAFEAFKMFFGSDKGVSHDAMETVSGFSAMTMVDINLLASWRGSLGVFRKTQHVLLSFIPQKDRNDIGADINTVRNRKLG